MGKNDPDIISEEAPNSAPELPIYTDVDKVPLPLLGQFGGHWKAMYLKQKRQHDVSVRQIIWSQLITVIIIGVAGIYLQNNRRALLLFGGALIVYPAISSLFSSTATGLGASLHHGIDETEMRGKRLAAFLVRGLAQSVAVSLVAGAIVGLVSSILGTLFFEAAFVPTLKLALLVAGATGLVGLPLTTGLVLLVRRLESNPDDITGPAANTIFSLLPLVFIVLFSRWLA